MPRHAARHAPRHAIVSRNRTRAAICHLGCLEERCRLQLSPALCARGERALVVMQAPHPHSARPQLNERLSLGQHRVWKRMAVRWSRAAPGHAALDVCCGSGDLAFELARAVGASGSVTGLDFAAEMLDDAEARRAPAASTRPAARPLAAMTWVQGDALALPFADATFDAATMGYGLRNVADIPKALAELARVLKPGASVAVLDFNNSEDALVDGLQARGRACQAERWGLHAASPLARAQCVGTPR